MTKTKQQEIDESWNRHIRSQLSERDVNLEMRREWLNNHLAIQDNKCAYCGVSIQVGKIEGREDRQATIDHIIPRSKNGADTWENTLASCAACNSQKASDDLGVFLRSEALTERIYQAFSCPNHVSTDPGSKYFDIDALQRGIAIFIDGREFKNVHEYCITEDWAKLRLPRGKTRTGQPMTTRRAGQIVAIYRDGLLRLKQVRDMGFVENMREWL